MNKLLVLSLLPLAGCATGQPVLETVGKTATDPNVLNALAEASKVIGIASGCGVLVGVGLLLNGIAMFLRRKK